MRVPEKISEHHKLEDFDCNDEPLNDWLKRKALKNEYANDSRTYVICNENKQVIGYYSIATGSIEHDKSPSSLKRNAPNPISVMVLGRLAIDKRCQKRGLGKDLLRDAILRTLAVSEIAAVKALVVHAISPAAKQFYLENDFINSPAEMTLILPLKDIIQNM